MTRKLSIHFHTPEWNFPFSGSHKTFHFCYMRFLCLLKFLLDKMFMIIEGSSIVKEKKSRMAQAGLDHGASDL